MARLIVQFPGDAAVLVDGTPVGRTNSVIRVPVGSHAVRLEGEATEPPEHAITVTSVTDDDVTRVGFAPAEARIDRFSPLYCCYNGFLLGQFLSLSFARYAQKNYPIRRARMLEFLDEIDVAVDLPVEPPGIGDEGHVQVINETLPKLAERSKPLTDFVLLGSVLTHYGILAESDPTTSKEMLEQFEWLREKHALPPLDPARFVLRPGSGDPDDVLSPSLAYLAQVVDRLDVEPDTAFVIMPFKPPYAGYFSTFYRPSLERVGYRAFRAWGGLASEDYCDLLLKLIARSGIVWADVSELNDNVLYEIGAAHAFGKLSMLVVREEDAAATPANIGHDAVVRYSPAADDWPEGTVHLMAALIATLKLAAERGERLRVGPDAVATVLESTGKQLMAILTPAEARAARDEGQAKLEAADYAGAEERFDEAIRLGLDDALVLLGRGSSRVALERYAEAEADLDRVLEEAAETEAARAQHGVAAYFRGIAREQQENLRGALEDYGRAIDFGYDDADTFRRRARVRLALGDIAAARQDADRATAIEPDDPDTKMLADEVAAGRLDG